MKKPTIAELQKQLTEMTTRHDAEYRCRVSAIDRSNKLEQDARDKDAAFKQLLTQHSQELKSVHTARADAQQKFFEFKGMVLHYFMAVGNSETSGNKEQIAEMQKNIALYSPCFQLPEVTRW